MLVAVLAVAQHLLQPRRHLQGGGAAIGGRVRGAHAEGVGEPSRYRGVVGGRVREGFGGEALPLRESRTAQHERLRDRDIVGRVDDDRDVRVVLGGGSHHRGPANVDLLDDGVALRPRSGRLDERVQVDDHEIEGRHSELGELSFVRFEPQVGKNARVNLRVQRLDAAVEGLGESGDGRDLGYRMPGRRDRRRRRACRYHLDAAGGEGSSELKQPRLIAHRDEGAAHRHGVAVAVEGGVVRGAGHEGLQW